MFALFKETLTGLQDNNYGRIILGRSFKQVVWYWVKYLLLVVSISFLMAIFFLTNRLPQLPRFIETTFPDGQIEMKSGIFSSSIVQPFISGDSDFTFILDTNATASALDTYRSGLLISTREMILKSEDGTVTTQSFKHFPSFSTSRSDLVSFVSSNSVKIWFGLTIALLVLAILAGLLIWFYRFISFAVWSAIFLLITKYLLKKSLTYLNIFKLVVYASILPFLFSMLLSTSSSPILDILNLAIMAYFTFNWIRNLDLTSTLPPVTVSLPKSPSGRNRKKTA